MAEEKRFDQLNSQRRLYTCSFWSLVVSLLEILKGSDFYKPFLVFPGSHHRNLNCRMSSQRCSRREAIVQHMFSVGKSDKQKELLQVVVFLTPRTINVQILIACRVGSQTCVFDEQGRGFKIVGKRQGYDALSSVFWLQICTSCNDKKR